MTLIAHPVVGKQKSADICAAFIAGAPKSAQGHVFWGVNESNVREWDRIRKSGEDWFYGDNAFFDKTRGTHFRFAKNSVQHDGRGETDGKRFAALGIDIKPWRESGSQIVVCPQSESFMRCVAKWPGNWAAAMSRLLADRTTRPINVRGWIRDKNVQQASLGADLANAWALVTHSSSAAVTAILAGIPTWAAAGPAAFAENQARPEDPLPLADRLRWAGVLADNQFSVDEMKEGLAWRMINR